MVTIWIGKRFSNCRGENSSRLFSLIYLKVVFVCSYKARCLHGKRHHTNFVFYHIVESKLNCLWNEKKASWPVLGPVQKWRLLLLSTKWTRVHQSYLIFFPGFIKCRPFRTSHTYEHIYWAFSMLQSQPNIVSWKLLRRISFQKESDHGFKEKETGGSPTTVQYPSTNEKQ